jgi:hypothetical protein
MYAAKRGGERFLQITWTFTRASKGVRDQAPIMLYSCGLGPQTKAMIAKLTRCLFVRLGKSVASTIGRPGHSCNKGDAAVYQATHPGLFAVSRRICDK